MTVGTVEPCPVVLAKQQVSGEQLPSLSPGPPEGLFSMGCS
jgi:hypothetical protein